jgi:hypothetical protein
MRFAIAAVLFISLTSVGPGAEGENAYRDAKVGDWVEYQSKMTADGGFDQEGNTKITVVARDDKELTYEVLASLGVNGKTLVAPTQTLKTDLTKSYDAISALNLKQNNVKIEKLGEGKEKLKVAGKEYDTTWTRLRSTATQPEVTVVTDYKMWFCKDVPVNGLVRMDTTGVGLTSRLELIGSGRK